MSSPAASCALITQATASRYCSRNIESPSADLNDRPSRLASYQSGRGYEPVIAVGSIRSWLTRSISADLLPPRLHGRAERGELAHAARRPGEDAVDGRALGGGEVDLRPRVVGVDLGGRP